MAGSDRMIQRGLFLVEKLEMKRERQPFRFPCMGTGAPT
jgi:hypothetical protein